MIQNTPEEFDERLFDWGLNIRAPKVSREYEDIPDLNIYQIRQLADNMGSAEYKSRVLVSVNLMGRKCETHFLRMRSIVRKDDGSVWVKLPKEKKHSSDKTQVQLYSYVAKPFIEYLNQNNFGEDDFVFPTADAAFAKHLKKVSENILKTRVTPKTLRKIGVGIAESLGYSRADVERIGGWAANSSVVEYYFNRRKGVSTRNDDKVERELAKDIYDDVERLRAQNMALESKIATIERNSLSDTQKQDVSNTILEMFSRMGVDKIQKIMDRIEKDA